MVVLCPSSGSLEFTNSCVRESWHAILSSSTILIFLIFSIPVPLPQRVRRIIDAFKAPFRTYLSVEEAEALSASFSGNTADVESDKRQSGFRYPIILLGLLETLSWVAVAAHRLATGPSEPWNAGMPFIIAFSWAYTVIRPIAWPTATAPFDLLIVYFVHFVSSVLTIGAIYYGHTLTGAPYPSTAVWATITANLLIALTALVLVLNMPLGVPSSRVKKEDIVSVILLCENLL